MLRPDIKVGDTLWRVPYDVRSFNVLEADRGSFVTVTKVGRKWLTCTDKNLRYVNAIRIDRENGKEDGKEYSSPAQCFNDKEHYNEMCAVQSAWNRLQQTLRAVSFPTVPDYLTYERVNDAREYLDSLLEKDLY